MKLLLNTRNLTEPTEETLALYSAKRFNKLLKFIPRKAHFDPKLKIDAEFHRTKKKFELKIVLQVNGTDFVLNIHDEDMRRAIDRAVVGIRTQLERRKIKRWHHSF